MTGVSDDGVWYFAYGSNLHRAIFIERREMRPLAIRWGWIEDYQLTFDIPVGPGERGVANIAAVNGTRTYGALYLLPAGEFDRLDRTEGVNFGIYSRLPVEVVTDDGNRVAAFAYQSRISTTGRKPSPRYINLILEGAQQHGLPETYIRFLQSLELARDEREGDTAD